MAATGRYLYAWCLVALLLVATVTAQEDDADDEDDDDETDVASGINCEDGLIIPIWPGHENMGPGDRFGRGLLYITLMIYLFIGVAIASDKFMESIEMITAQEKEVTIKDPKSGKNQIVIVKVRIIKAGTEIFLIQPRVEETTVT